MDSNGGEIFISYKSERRRAAEHLAETLRRHGYTVWFDYQLVKGRDFGCQIDTRIRAAKALVALWCTQSVRSEWVREEVDLARDLGILVPTKIEACELPVGHRLKDYIDLADWDGSPRSHRLDPLLDAIAQKVGREPQPNFRALQEYEATWRRFGAPSLRAFALVDEGGEILGVGFRNAQTLCVRARGSPRRGLVGSFRCRPARNRALVSWGRPYGPTDRR